MRFQGLVFVAMLCGTTVGTLAKADSRLTISDDLPGATLDVGKPRISSHASVVPSVKVIGGVVLEAMNAGKFLSEKHLEAQCRTRLSNASDQDVALRLAFTFRLPDQTGIDRVAMLKYGMPDLRDLFDADLRWINHYGFKPLDMPSLAGGLSG